MTEMSRNTVRFFLLSPSPTEELIDVNNKHQTSISEVIVRTHREGGGLIIQTLQSTIIGSP